MKNQELTYYPNPGDFSKVTFWDTDFANIDWQRHANFVIARVFGYGTEEEQRVVVRIYGLETIKEFERNFVPNDFNHLVKTNLQKMMSYASL